MIREATLNDLTRVAEMGVKFTEAAGLPKANVLEMADFARNLILGDNGVVFVSEGGMIAGMIAPLFYRPMFTQAHEVAWWCEDGSGLKLLRAYELWAERMGADEIMMSSLHGFTPPAMARLMDRRGYSPRDTSFVRRR